MALAVCFCMGFCVLETCAATCIGVTKGVACVTCTSNETGVALECFSFNGQFNHDAYGVRSDTQTPVFCYEITVTNSGPTNLVNVWVKDDHFGLLTNNAFIPQHGSIVFRMFTNWAAVAPATGAYVITNTVTATSTNIMYAGSCPDVDTNGVLSASSSAVVHVRPVGIQCTKLVSVNGSTPISSFSGSNVIATNIAWYVILTNTGQADLTNVIISDLGSPDFLPCMASIALPGLLPVGASTFILLCTNNGFTSCTNLVIDNTVRVVAQAAAEGTNCVWDINGSNVTVQTSCPASLSLLCQSPIGIILSRGLPQVIVGPTNTQVGPQLTNGCGVLNSAAKWFQLFKDNSYPEGIADISTEGSSYDTFVAVYAGPLVSPATLTNIACNDNISQQNKQSRVTFKLPPGSGPFWLVIDGKGNTNGTLRLTLGYEPSMASFAFVTNHGFALTSSVAPALSYQLQASTNLGLSSAMWTNLFSTNLPNLNTNSAIPATNFPRLKFIDTNAWRYNRRYYRIVPGSQ